MKHILLIATGGTIASKPEDGLLTPQITPQELVEYVPELKQLCQISTLQPFNKDSTNMTYGDWFTISQLIKENYDTYDGFVVTHGTDTMAYCSSALSYFVQNSSKPIVITGSQKSIYLRDTDARNNLFDAFVYASNDKSMGVHIVFDGKVILGTRARKMRTKSFNAFSSIDYPVVAWVQNGIVKNFIHEEVIGKPLFCKEIDPNVIAIKLIPGLRTDFISSLADYSAVVIESFGMGGLPNDDNGQFSSAIAQIRSRGVKVIMTTQVPHEGSELGIYKVGSVDGLDIIDARDMTIEAIIGKTVWALGQTHQDDQFKSLFLTPIGMDIF